MKTNKLRRSKRESVIGGVAGGLGDYFNTDPVIFRILFVVLAFTGGGGVFIYLLMWIFVPKEDIVFEPQNNQNHNTRENDSTHDNETDEFGQQNANADNTEDDPATFGEDKISEIPKKNGSLLGGTILIIVGGFFLADDFFPWFNWEYLWPIALIVAGLAIIKINYDKK